MNNQVNRKTSSEDPEVKVRVSESEVTTLQLLKGERYGMKVSEYNEIVAFLESPQTSPCYP